MNTIEMQKLQTSEKPDLIDHAHSACDKIPPLWPLSHFVAVNPYVGLGEKNFAEGLALMHQATHQAGFLPAAAFSEMWKNGKITIEDLSQACQALGCPEALASLRLGPPDFWPEENLILSVADKVDAVKNTKWSSLIVEEVSKWCAAYYDDGQSLWRMPWRNLSLFGAWKRGASKDCTLEVSGLPGTRQYLQSLPDDALLAMEVALNQIGLTPEAREKYFLRLLMSVKGWAGYVQYLVRENKMKGQPDESLIQLLAIRLAYDAAMHHAFGISPQIPAAGKETASVSAVWQEALEISHRRTWMGHLKPAVKSLPTPNARPSVQAVFCIDVRSEVMRRAIESADPHAETIGFAGFFGFPIEVVPLNHGHGTARCPVLLSPSHKVEEHLHSSDNCKDLHAENHLKLKSEIGGVWKTFKTASITSFPFVESLGLAYTGTLLRESLIIPAKKSEQLSSLEVKKECCSHAATSGISLEDRVNMAKGALHNMGLTSNFARLVLICGHGSQSANNPFASSLDCGACGGHAGDANARVAATVLNDPEVRALLPERGINIPKDTIFVAALHNTTTDEILFFEEKAIPSSHHKDLAPLRTALQSASELAQAERSLGFGFGAIASSSLKQAIEEKSRNWAEVRPEWGLAGNHAFIAAPRAYTKDIKLGGKVFLHNYHPDLDPGFKILELILVAPMVVANWINMQYFASASNNDLFGSGNKLLHNVIGKIGVLEGNGGDLRSGLPWQSVHDGKQLMHTPLRLNVCVQAPPEAMDDILSRHPSVADLVNNRWLHLFAITESGLLQRQASGRWTPAMI